MDYRCPFCEIEIDKDLSLYGGTCPGCFADIPGEEAPTDPGEDEEVAAPARPAGLRWALPLALVAGVVVAVVFLSEPAPPPNMIDFDAIEDYPEPEITGALEEPEVFEAEEVEEAVEEPPVEEAKEEVVAPAPRPRPRQVKPKPEPEPEPVEEDKGPGALTALTPMVTQQRQPDVLTDDADIQVMIGQAMNAQIPTLTACYERQLKVDESLRGRWRIGYVVQEDGTTRDGTAEGMDQSHAAFEECIVRELGKWKFDKIASERPVQRSLRFTPSEF